jgi:nucleotide-binding universal stress UspA family protein
MTIRDILAVIGGNHADPDILDIAWQIGSRDGAHMRILHLRHDRGAYQPASRLDRFLARIDGIDPEPERDPVDGELVARESEAEQHFKLWCKRHALALASESPPGAGASASWRVERTSEPAALLHLARVADLTIMLRSGLPDIDSTVELEEALFHTGRSALLVPATQLHPIHRHAMIAWNGSLAASRALAMALPLLGEAGRVTLFSRPEKTLPEPASLAAVQRYLAWHGIEAQPAAVSHPDLEIGADLLATCRASDATLLVMGAYSHGLARERLLGGVTQHVLEHAPIPVLMAH